MLQNPDRFFDKIRSTDTSVFGVSLTQGQVDGINHILDECDVYDCDLPQTAYILATAYGESGFSMMPTRENLYYRAQRLRQVWPSRFPTDEIAREYAGKPRKLANYVYDGVLGNIPGTEDGWDYRGNGIGQITGRDNHRRWGKVLGVNLEAHPELLEDPELSARALVAGVVLGLATGLRLEEFVSGDSRDYRGARRVWNGTFEAVKYARYAEDFERALSHSGWVTDSTPAPVPDDPGVETTPAKGGSSLLQLIIDLLSTIFGGRK